MRHNFKQGDKNSRKQELNSKQQKEMSTTLYFTLLSLLVLTHLSICNGVSLLGLHSLENNGIDAMVTRVCSKSIGECLEMDSEMNRRVLVVQKKYISYETLKRDMVPCATPGASYYNCQAGQAHHYSRGCEVITGCARNIRDIKT